MEKAGPDESFELDLTKPPSKMETSSVEVQSDLLLGHKAKRATSKRVLVGALVCGGLLVALAVGFGVGFGTAVKPGKSAWPECVGLTGQGCKSLILGERPDLQVYVGRDDAAYTADYDEGRVRIMCSHETGVVSRVPSTG